MERALVQRDDNDHPGERRQRVRRADGLGQQHVQHQEGAIQLHQRRRVAGDFDEHPRRFRQPWLAGRQHRRQADTGEQTADDGEQAQQHRGLRALHQGSALIGVQQKVVVQAETSGPVNEYLQPMTHASPRNCTQARAMRRPASATLSVAVAMDRRNHGDKP
ncbi:hypothetical protein D3C85_1132240 [compost metagenome]